jgi:hypothetical protein
MSTSLSQPRQIYAVGHDVNFVVGDTPTAQTIRDVLRYRNRRCVQPFGGAIQAADRSCRRPTFENPSNSECSVVITSGTRAKRAATPP